MEIIGLYKIEIITKYKRRINSIGKVRLYMKQLIASVLAVIFTMSGSVFAAEETLDVFEEKAEQGELLLCENFTIDVEKNKSVKDQLNCQTQSNEITYSVVAAPQRGEVTINQETGGFVYRPLPGMTGQDSFTFRVSASGIESNIARCDISIVETQATQKTVQTEPLGFIYEDMREHWASYAAIKMVELDVLKGFRVGDKYYFYPEQQLTRIDVIGYLVAALKLDDTVVDPDQTHIFADSASLPDALNRLVYIAHKIGIVEGQERDGKMYLDPYEKVTRVEFMKMLDKAMSSKTRSDVALDFADAAQIPSWGVQCVKNMIGYGIAKGDSAHKIRPNDIVTRAEVVEMLYQMIKYNETAITQTSAMRMKAGFYGRELA